jgi:cell division protein FtsB
MIVLLVLTASYLQYVLWLGKGGKLYVSELEESVVTVRTELERLYLKNSILAADVADLKEGEEAIEERARNEMGMIKKGEKFVRITRKPDKSPVMQFEELSKN